MNYDDEEVDKVEPFDGPAIKFSHIIPDDKGLREYQKKMKHDIYDQWDKVNNVMLQMPTGTGKTIVFVSIVNDIRRWCIMNSPKSKIAIIAHRRELIDQASRKLTVRGIRHGIIQGSRSQDIGQMIQVASIQTFVARRTYEKVRRMEFDFIIIDEAHHSMAPSYKKLWEMYPNSKKLGVTATPWRMSHTGFRSLFDTLVLSKSIEWFVNNGYLSNYDYVSVRPTSEEQRIIKTITQTGADGDYKEDILSEMFDTSEIRAKLYDSYKQFASGKKGIIYAINRQHAYNIKDLYAAHGVSIEMIDGTTPADDRNEIIEDFKEGAIQVIVNVNIFSEGFDCPDIEFIQLARPTRSLSMYLQQVGRGLRISANKERAVILDNVGLYLRFGSPMARRHWQYHFNGRKGAKEGFNDGGVGLRDIEIIDDEPDYTEGSEKMEVIEKAVGNQQIRSESANDAEEHLAPYNVIRQDGCYGVCNDKKRITVPPIYEGMHPYYKGYIPFKQNDKWGIMLGNGVIKVKPKYYWIGPFVNGIAEVQNTEKTPKYYINSKLQKL